MPGSDQDNTSPSSGNAASEPPLIPREEWEAVWPGSKLDWSSPRLPIQFYVELPFWLMMPEGTFEVKYGEATTKLTVVHGCREIQCTTMHLKNKSSTIFIVRPDEEAPNSIQQAIEHSKDGFSAHIHRTTLIIDSSALESALKCRIGKNLERAQSIEYFCALAAAHLPIINKLITAYRRAANDPFVQEVSEATVPIWFIRTSDHFLRVSLTPYADLEYRANWPKNDGTQEPANLATVAELADFLVLAETPGETILHDSWSYFYSGRFSDAIRGLVTALEVLLESKYSDALKKNGSNEEMVQAALKSTATKFTTRFNNYLHITNRTIPGPLLSWVPYITGVRLREELNNTRELRHKIVHEGYRMNTYAPGPMLRAAETMTWLFDWLEDSERSSKNRFKLYPLKNFLKGRVQFGPEYTTDGVKLMEYEMTSPTEDHVEYMADDQLWGKHTRGLYGPDKDYALFVKMSIACIVGDSSDIMKVFMGAISAPISDYEILNPLPGVRVERFRCYIDEVLTAIFLVELDGELSITDLSGAMVRLLQLRVEYLGKQVHGVCVVNHQQHIPPALREVYRTLPDDLNALLISCDLSLVFASHIARYIRCVRDHNWPLTQIRDELKASGYVACRPPNSTFAGTVLKVFPKLGVLGVSVEADPQIHVGDQLLVMSAARYEFMTVSSIRVREQPAKSVGSGEAGLMVGGEVKQISEGAFVFKISQPPPSQ